MRTASRAQASVEYIVNYGWAILVILVVGAVLWQMGILKTSTSTTTFSGFGKLKPQLGGTGLTTGGIFQGTFMNGAGNKMSVKGVKVYDAGTGALLCCSHATLSAECGTAGGTNVQINGGSFPDSSGYFPRIAAGDAFLVHIEGCTVSGAGQGDPYDINVEITYDSLSGNQKLPHGDAGDIKGSFE